MAPIKHKDDWTDSTSMELVISPDYVDFFRAHLLPSVLHHPDYRCKEVGGIMHFCLREDPSSHDTECIVHDVTLRLGAVNAVANLVGEGNIRIHTHPTQATDNNSAREKGKVSQLSIGDPQPFSSADVHSGILLFVNHFLHHYPDRFDSKFHSLYVEECKNQSRRGVPSDQCCPLDLSGTIGIQADLVWAPTGIFKAIPSRDFFSAIRTSQWKGDIGSAGKVRDVIADIFSNRCLPVWKFLRESALKLEVKYLDDRNKHLGDLIDEMVEESSPEGISLGKVNGALRHWFTQWAHGELTGSQVPLPEGDPNKWTQMLGRLDHCSAWCGKDLGMYLPADVPGERKEYPFTRKTYLERICLPLLFRLFALVTKPHHSDSPFQKFKSQAKAYLHKQKVQIKEEWIREIGIVKSLWELSIGLYMNLMECCFPVQISFHSWSALQDPNTGKTNQLGISVRDAATVSITQDLSTASIVLDKRKRKH